MKIYAIGHLVKTNPIKANFNANQTQFQTRRRFFCLLEIIDIARKCSYILLNLNGKKILGIHQI